MTGSDSILAWPAAPHLCRGRGLGDRARWRLPVAATPSSAEHLAQVTRAGPALTSVVFPTFCSNNDIIVHGDMYCGFISSPYTVLSALPVIYVIPAGRQLLESAGAEPDAQRHLVICPWRPISKESGFQAPRLHLGTWPLLLHHTLTPVWAELLLAAP